MVWGTDRCHNEQVDDNSIIIFYDTTVLNKAWSIAFPDITEHLAKST